MGLIFDDDRVDLSRFDDDYARLRSESGGGWDRVPDGSYETRVEDVRLATTPTTGNPMIVWRLRILGPAHHGGVLIKTRVITAKTLGQVKRDLETFGIQLERLSALEDHLREMEQREVTAIKKTQADGWSDVLFVRRKAAAASASSGEYTPY